MLVLFGASAPATGEFTGLLVLEVLAVGLLAYTFCIKHIAYCQVGFGKIKSHFVQGFVSDISVDLTPLPFVRQAQ